MAGTHLECELGLRLLHECFIMVSMDSFPLTRRSVIWERLAHPTGKVTFRSLSSALRYAFDSKSCIVEMF